MNKIFLLIFLLLPFALDCHSQTSNNEKNFLFKKFDCQNCNKAALDKVYQTYKNKFQVYVTIKNLKLDLTQKMIDDMLTQEMLNQLCIDSWYECNQSGVEYTYNRFKRQYFNISRDDYLDKINYLEILRLIHSMALEYKSKYF